MKTSPSKTISFYPGPSKIHEKVNHYFQEGFECGIFEVNHRSPSFMDLLGKTKKLLQSKLEIPIEYDIVLTSSATECWEIIAQSLTGGTSVHFHNGAFGEKWFDYTNKITSRAISSPFGLDDKLSMAGLAVHKNTDLICITHNETSNGTQLNDEVIRTIRERHDDIVIAVDATSSMAGVRLEWEQADIWFASVQKCFGLPPGLAVMILSPRAIERARKRGDKRYYNSLNFVLSNYQKNQTPYTPNTIGIYLLSRYLEQVSYITEVAGHIHNRYTDISSFLEEKIGLQHVCANKSCRSQTVLAYKYDVEELMLLKQRMKKNNIVLGNGYGSWKTNSFRVANFPAITDAEFDKLKDVFQSIKQN